MTFDYNDVVRDARRVQLNVFKKAERARLIFAATSDFQLESAVIIYDQSWGGLGSTTLLLVGADPSDLSRGMPSDMIVPLDSDPRQQATSSEC